MSVKREKFKVVFTDLDGTLLDEKYSFKKAAKAVEFLNIRRIPLIICTSKTRAEIEVYRQRLKNKHPFISENGGGVFVPTGYFNFAFKFSRRVGDYYLIKFGADYTDLVRFLKKLSADFKIRLFSDMSALELSRDAGLSLREARLAKKRDFDEAFSVSSPGDKSKVFREIRRAGFRFTEGGRYAHIMGGSDKGRAVRALVALYKKKYGRIETIAIGDSDNDFSMLDSVSRGYLVMKKNKTYASQEYLKAKGVNGSGWKEVILREFND